jgi:hypothetical protein
VALPLYNSAEGTSGSAITTAAGTASTGSNTFDTLTGTGIAYNSLGAAHGSTSFQFTTAATVVAAYLAWTTSLGTLATNQTLYVRFYFRFPATPTSSVRMCQILNGTTLLTGLNCASGGAALEVRTSADALATGGSAGNMSANAGVVTRIEAAYTGIGGGATAGGCVAQWFTGDSGTASGTATVTGANFGTLAPNALRLGITTANASVSTAYQFDDPAVSATGMPAIPGGVASHGPQRRSPQRQVAQPGRGVFPMFGWRAGRRGLCIAEKRLWTPERARASQ